MSAVIRELSGEVLIARNLWAMRSSLNWGANALSFTSLSVVVAPPSRLPASGGPKGRRGRPLLIRAIIGSVIQLVAV
jgi:hypothetical protein